MPNEHWTISGQCQISNLNWKMENGTLRQFPDLLIVPRIEDRGSSNRAYGDPRSSCDFVDDYDEEGSDACELQEDRRGRRPEDERGSRFRTTLSHPDSQDEGSGRAGETLRSASETGR